MASIELHLLETRTRELEYLRLLSGRRNALQFNPGLLKEFCYSEKSYQGPSITDDLVTDVWMEFCKNTRQKESETYLRTLAGVNSSMYYNFILY